MRFCDGSSEIGLSALLMLYKVVDRFRIGGEI
jgi:hypothetical protein